MAGDWIKMRCDLIDDPAVIAIAAATGVDEYGVVGRLHRLWAWAGSHTADGKISLGKVSPNCADRSVTETFIDRYIGVANFARAMSDAGWLVIENGGMTFPKFDVHNSKSAKQRALNTLRMSQNRAVPIRTKARPEKRREEKSIQSALQTVPPAVPVEKKARPPDELFDAIAEVTGSDPKVTGSHVGRVKRALLSADPPYTAAEVRLLPASIRARGLDFTLTLNSMEKYIGWVRQPAPEARHAGPNAGNGVGSAGRVSSPAGKYANVGTKIVVGAPPAVSGTTGEAGVPPQSPDPGGDRSATAQGDAGGGLW